MLAGRHIVLGVTGGVAAYKSAYLARRLIEAGAEVRTVMTAAAAEFLGPQTLAAITGHQPLRTLFGRGEVSPHTELARWADAVVVAPATAATLSRIANGLADDALSATVLASEVPVLLAPAMHSEMWHQPATQRNIAILEGDGYALIGPETGPLAGGDEGIGRVAEPDDIAATLEALLGGGTLAGVHVLVTAGGTREPIDPVRYLGNRSSGKMGHHVAIEAARRGANVTLVTTAEGVPQPGVTIHAVETAQEMADTVAKLAPEADIAVLAAAVADFRPAAAEVRKLRRAEGPPTLELEATPDILASIASSPERPFLVGFAAETGSITEAVTKAKDKGVDLLVANDVTKEGSGFGTDTNEVTLILPDGSTEPWELLPKREVARRLWDRINEMWPAGEQS